MTVTKKTMDRYDIRANHEWATICVREWKGEQYFGGEILIHSSFGSWGNSWTACSNRFKSFLTHCDFDYTFGKFMGCDLRKFDGEASTKAMLVKVIELRRERSIDKDEARQLYDALEDVNEQSIESWVHSIHDFARDFDRQCIRDLLDEPWHLAQDKPDIGAVGFWRELWPEFVAALRAEITEAAAA